MDIIELGAEFNTAFAHLLRAIKDLETEFEANVEVKNYTRDKLIKTLNKLSQNKDLDIPDELFGSQVG